jgi:hypothetical protein
LPRVPPPNPMRDHRIRPLAEPGRPPQPARVRGTGAPDASAAHKTQSARTTATPRSPGPSPSARRRPRLRPGSPRCRSPAAPTAESRPARRRASPPAASSTPRRSSRPPTSMMDLPPGGAGPDPSTDWPGALPLICRPGPRPVARIDRSGGRDLIGALASTVDVLSAVPAGYAFGYRRTGSLLPASWKIWQYSPAVCAGRRCGSSVVPVADR